MNADKDADIGDLQAEIAQLRADLAKTADTLKAIVANEAGATCERMSDTAEAVGHEISERPFTSVATAFGTDIVLGMLFSRRA